MTNPMLNSQQLLLANHILNRVRADILSAALGDSDTLFALRRKIAKELSYDERGKPAQRKRLKHLMRRKQNGFCALCTSSLPEKNCVLDRIEAKVGYREDNVRLLCQVCDFSVQSQKDFK